MNLLKKNILYTLILVSSFLFLKCSGAVSPQFGTYKMQLVTQMQAMDDVLFAGHYSEFMSTYVNPTYITSMGGVDKAMLQFDNTEQQRLYRELKIAQNITPFYDENSNEMVYTANALFKPITFKLVNGKWYMQGDWFKN